MQLLQLTPDVQAEFMRAAKIQHRLYCKALRRASSAKLRKQRGWWAVEVQHNVAYHMGWLAKAQSHGVLKKLKTYGRGATKRSTRGGGVSLGQMGHRYRIMSLTPAIAKKYKAMAVLTTTLAAMPAPKNFKLYNGNRQALAAMPSKYHDLWYFLMFF